MKRALRVLTSLTMMASLSAVQGAGATPGSFTKYTFPGGGGAPSRTYWVYVPATIEPDGSYPLVVYLHGCTQNGPDAGAGTRWNEVADERNFVVAYPEQSSSANSIQCWNWFQPSHQSRGSGEPATIAGITRAVMETEPIDPNRVYIAGASAGGVMTNIMGATYPDLYAAIAPLAGCPYAFSGIPCGDGTGLGTYQAMGNFKRRMPILIGQGTTDPVVNVLAGIGTVTEWLGANDLIDDGMMNGSVPRTPASYENYVPEEAPRPLSGDPCIGAGTPCPGGIIGFQGSYPYTIFHYVDGAGEPLLDFVLIHGLMHNYPGGDRQGSATDPLGPDASRGIYDFFMSHPMP